MPFSIFSYVGDGRFHLESIMIANPSVPAFRYDPYDKKFTREIYDHTEMRDVRAQAVGDARKSLAHVAAGTGEEKEGEGRGAWAVVLGTLGRQGNLSVLNVSPCPPYKPRQTLSELNSSYSLVH